MNPTYPARIKVGIALACLAVFLWQIPLIIAKFGQMTHPSRKEAVALREVRFAAMRNALPSRGAVGYITDGPLNRPLGDGKTEDVDSIVQYCLAPLIVKTSTEPELIVGDFDSRESGAPVIAAHHLIVVRDYGNGLLLLRKAGP